MNTDLFQTFAGRQVPATDTTNSHNAPAYAFSSRHQLAQYAATGCLNTTFYATAETQLHTVLALAGEVDAEFIAKTAIYCRERGFMKDLPALLCALLTVEDGALCERVFDRVIDDGKMLRNFVQIVRSGVVGRKSLGSMPRRLVRRWFESRTDEQVFRASVGTTPSLADVIKLAHPRPATKAREALYGWLLGKTHDVSSLPEIVRAFEKYKEEHSKGHVQVPDVPFQMLTALDLGRAEWMAIARKATWQQTRMNLNTFARHGVFDKAALVDVVAARLRDVDEIKRARAFPYQLMMAYTTTAGEVPGKIKEALQDAMEIAIENVPQIDGRVYVCPDVSGSMASAISGNRGSATTAVRCIDVAALVAAAVLRKNRHAEVLPFEHEVVPLRLNPRDSVMTNARKLASVGGGGTSCSAPLAKMNAEHKTGELVIFVSDNESWVDAGRQRNTAMMREWATFKARSPRAKLVCIDIQPNGTTQALESGDILNVGGFSDAVFDVVAAFAAGGAGAKHWVDVIDAMKV